MHTGTVKWYTTHKKFGFIEVDGGNQLVFVDQTSQLPAAPFELETGDRVEFFVEQGPKALHALEVRLLSTNRNGAPAPHC